MTRRRELVEHRRSLGEIRAILNSMKTLAYIETRKLNRYLDAQHAVRQSIETAAIDFLASYPASLPPLTTTQPVYLLVGSERGFCGNFNTAVLRHLNAQLSESPRVTPIIVATGHKLELTLSGDQHVAAQLAGAIVVEEINGVLAQLAHTLADLQQRFGTLQLHAIYHQGMEGGLVSRQLLPPFQNDATPAPVPAYPVDIQLSPESLLLELTEHYLLAALTEILYTSLMAENHHRVQHLDGAIRHLDETTNRMERETNALRQEEITEEIEVILLSVESLEEQ